MSVQDDRDDTDYFLSRVTGTVVETRPKKKANGEDGVTTKGNSVNDKPSKSRFGWTKNEESETDQLLREAPETGSLRRARRTFGILCFVLFLCFSVGSVFYYLHVHPLAPIFPLGFYGGLALGAVGIFTSLWGVGTSCTRAVWPRIVYGILAILMVLCCIGGLAFGILGSTHIAHQLEGRWHHVVNTKPAEVCKFENHYECSGWTQNCANFTELLVEEVYWDSNNTHNASVDFRPATSPPHSSTSSPASHHHNSHQGGGGSSNAGSGGSNNNPHPSGGSNSNNGGQSNFGEAMTARDFTEQQWGDLDGGLVLGASNSNKQPQSGNGGPGSGGGSAQPSGDHGGSGGGKSTGGASSNNKGSGGGSDAPTSGSGSNGGGKKPDGGKTPAPHNHTTTVAPPTPPPTTAAPAKELRCALCMAEGYTLPAKNSAVTIKNATHTMFVNTYNTTCAHAFETKVKHRLYFILGGMGGAMVIALVCLWLAWSSRVRIVEASIPTF